MPRFKLNINPGSASWWRYSIPFPTVLRELVYELGLETLHGAQATWIERLQKKYHDNGKLTDRECEVLWDIYEQHFK